MVSGDRLVNDPEINLEKENAILCFTHTHTHTHTQTLGYRKWLFYISNMHKQIWTFDICRKWDLFCQQLWMHWGWNIFLKSLGWSTKFNSGWNVWRSNKVVCEEVIKCKLSNLSTNLSSLRAFSKTKSLLKREIKFTLTSIPFKM